ncbi:Intracellular serine protease [Paraglaciecola mesophila]|uniref:Intracellular serine protease n=1 Tax=Paraglaciecola mesophila TaxID=197222 RepID=A0A857JJD4_9ALTE|nr:S8 family serine peptidase [Paraglaciecola mesophila]QHJ11706.1 Intracellular serine protease [Paraglaciecola mesophila]
MKNDLLNRFTSYFVGCLCMLITANSTAITLTEVGTQNTVLDAKQRQLMVEQLQKNNSLRVIVELDTDANDLRAVGQTNSASSSTTQALSEPNTLQAIANAQASLHTTMSQSGALLKHSFTHLPMVVYDIDMASLSVLEKANQVKSIQIDEIRQPSLLQSTAIIGSGDAYAIGASGAGKTLAVLDSGVESNHPFLAGKVVSEACFSTNRSSGFSESVCPSGNNDEIAQGAARACDFSGCYHGTHVAGIAAGNSENLHGVAKDADIIAIQVFSKILDSNYCSGSPPCLGAYDSDVIQGLERVYALRHSYAIPSVNLSLGSGGYLSHEACDSANRSYASAVSKLNDAGIAVVIASGNNGYSNKISAPGCVSHAISVGATTDSDGVAWFTNKADFLTLLAPGTSIQSSVPGGSYSSAQGTSMAAPHVAGAFAALASLDNAPDNTQILSALLNTAKAIDSGSLTFGRIALGAAAGNLTPEPEIDQQLSIRISVDNAEELYFNGVLLGGSDNWKSSKLYNVNVTQKNNVLAVKAMDVDGLAALIAELELEGQALYSDENWKVSTEFVDGWQQTAFDDSQWQAASSYGYYGVWPWYKKVSGWPSNSQAQWLWSDERYDDNTVYFRYHITASSEPAPEPVVINTTTIVEGEVGQPYSADLTASGGSESFTWTLVSGNLPSGLELNGQSGKLAGTPSVAGEFTFTVEAKDSTGAQAHQELTLSIAPAPVITETATITISVDNFEDTYFNGVFLGSSTNWQYAKSYTVELVPGRNVLAVKAQDVDGVAALIAKIETEQGIIVSDSDWKIATQASEGWNTQDFDDSTWSNATAYGAYGAQPWRWRVNRLNGANGANWIWSGDNDLDNVVYFRLVIERP